MGCNDVWVKNLCSENINIVGMLRKRELGIRKSGRSISTEQSKFHSFHETCLQGLTRIFSASL